MLRKQYLQIVAYRQRFHYSCCQVMHCSMDASSSLLSYKCIGALLHSENRAHCRVQITL